LLGVFLAALFAGGHRARLAVVLSAVRVRSTTFLSRDWKLFLEDDRRIV
jgi:hypothetical protein